MTAPSHRAALAMLLALGLGACQRPGAEPATPSSATVPAPLAAASPASAPQRATGLQPPDFTSLVEHVGPSVVNVTTTQTVRATGVEPGMPDDPLFEFFRRFIPTPPGGGGGGPGAGPEFRSRGLGSGFVIDAEGFILTNAHVVAEADRVTVRLAGSNREYRAKVVGSDRQTDVALLQVDAKNLPVAKLGDEA